MQSLDDSEVISWTEDKIEVTNLTEIQTVLRSNPLGYYCTYILLYLENFKYLTTK